MSKETYPDQTLLKILAEGEQDSPAWLGCVLMWGAFVAGVAVGAAIVLIF